MREFTKDELTALLKEIGKSNQYPILYEIDSGKREASDDDIYDEVMRSFVRVALKNENYQETDVTMLEATFQGLYSGVPASFPTNSEKFKSFLTLVQDNIKIAEETPKDVIDPDTGKPYICPLLWDVILLPVIVVRDNRTQNKSHDISELAKWLERYDMDPKDRALKVNNLTFDHGRFKQIKAWYEINRKKNEYDNMLSEEGGRYIRTKEEAEAKIKEINNRLSSPKQSNMLAVTGRTLRQQAAPAEETAPPTPGETSTGAPAPGPANDPRLLEPTANNLLYHVLNGGLAEVQEIIQTVQAQDNHEALLIDLLTNQQATAVKGPPWFAEEVTCSAWEGCFREIDKWMREWIYDNCPEIRDALDDQARRIPERVSQGELVIYDDAPLHAAGRSYISAVRHYISGPRRLPEALKVIKERILSGYAVEQRHLPRNFLQEMLRKKRWDQETRFQRPPPRSLKTYYRNFCLPKDLGVNVTHGCVLIKGSYDKAELRHARNPYQPGPTGFSGDRHDVGIDLGELGIIRQVNLQAQNNFIQSLPRAPSQQQRSRSPSSGP